MPEQRRNLGNSLLSAYAAGDGILAEAKFHRDKRPRVAGRPAGPDRKRTVIITARIVISRSCGEVTRAPGSRGGKTGLGTRRPEEIQKCSRKRRIASVNCLGEWAEWRLRANSQARSVSYLRRDRGAGPRPDHAPRQRRLSKLAWVLVSVWPVRVDLTTGSNAAEAGDGPLPVAAGTGSASATFSRACASVSRRSDHLVVLATGLRP
jgi:hypothetical protein